jgi:phage tail-like protein
MTTQDANNATWYMLRYATDYTPRPASAIDPAPPQFVPASAPNLIYDDSRHLLELLPVKPNQELPPLPGFALDLTGEIYRVDPATLRLLRRMCDGHETEVLCEPGVLRAPAGLALDRRGFLYVADALLGRVIVLRPEDGSAVAILAHGLVQPVDVAVAPDGRIYVADRGAGRIAVFDAGFRPRGSFVSRSVNPMPAAPRPVAVMTAPDGAVLVADADYPWLLRFDPDGAPLGDEALAVELAPLLAAGMTLDDPSSLLAGPPAVFVAGACRPPFGADDVGVRQALIHRALRLLALHLSSAFPTTGVFLSAVLDGKTAGTIWHKLLLSADLPPETWITVETATSDTVATLVSALSGSAAGDDLPWAAPSKGGAPIPFTTLVADQLVQSPPGRYMRLRITLGGSGAATPGLRWLKVLFPRVSYLDNLPRVYQRDPDAALFLQHYLALFERVFTGVEDRYEQFSRWLDPRAAPLAIIDWLALLVDLSFDPSWSLARRRALVEAAMELYAKRGTLAGLSLYVQIYTGSTPIIREMFLERPGRSAVLGAGQGILGSGFPLAAPAAGGSAQAGQIAAYAHRFVVFVQTDDACEAETLLPVVDRIVAQNKPAHTIHTIVPLYPDARVGVHDTIGLDLVVGGGPLPPAAEGGLGVDTVLRGRPPPYGPTGFNLP